MMQKAIFPLPVVLYPNGVTRLRIFEPRYLRMVSQASGDIGFVISVFNQKSPANISPIGTLVNISDFDQLDDGTLGINVQAQSLVTISNCFQEPDKLHQGQIIAINHWPQQPMSQTVEQLALRLENVFNDNPDAKQLYPQTNFNCANWVCARWLELLPLNPTLKALFFNPESFDQAIELLSTVVLAHKVVSET